MDSAPRVLVLTGTTASGKTEVSIPLAQCLNAEIINADSRQVFRELYIGTAPPTEAQLAAVPHHFVRSMSLKERWSAGDFARAARERIESLIERGRRAVVVGGSMLYLKALLDGLYDSDAEPELNYAALKAEWDRRGGDEMMRELREVDPSMADRTLSGDHHRALRAIGFFRATGERLSDRMRSTTVPLQHRFKLYFLYGDRAETYERVNARADEMIANGLVDEVRALAAAGFTERNCNALRTHGYQEVFPYLRGECDHAAMRAAIQQAVRHYVKRQLTWYRRDPRAIWTERSFTESADAVARHIANDFGEST